MTNGGDSVAMDGPKFVTEFCHALFVELKSTQRIGYEALRWAVLSTNSVVSQRAFTIYRALLEPLNHATVKVVLLGLVGALEQWEQVEFYRSGNNASSNWVHREVFRILDTLIRMAEQLEKTNLLEQHPALFWAGVSLLRANVAKPQVCLSFI